MKELTHILASHQIKTDEESKDFYGRDWTKYFSPKVQAVVFPESTDQIKEIVLWARKTKTSLVPSGGRTGLSGGAFAIHNEVVVSLEKMNQILSFNEIESRIHCQAGVITEKVQHYARDKNLFYPVDFAASGSSQIGGNVATNAGGIRVIRYGMTRSWVTSLTVVTGQGDILTLGQGLVKNATGYDLKELFIGSEGSLGFITEVELQLTKVPQDPVVLLLATQDLSSIMEIFKLFNQNFSLTAFEMFTDKALDHVLRAGHVKNPLNESAPYYLVVELEKPNESTLDLVTEKFEMAFEKSWLIDGSIAQTSQQAKLLWRLREDISESLAPHQPYKNDISVRVSKIPEFLNVITDMMHKNYPDFEVIWFGHIGDGNLHVNILKPDQLSSEDFMAKCTEVNKLLFTELQKLGGSVSAEHGVGLVKKPYLQFTRSLKDIELMKGIKKVFDPDGILNPGKIFD